MRIVTVYLIFILIFSRGCNSSDPGTGSHIPGKDDSDKSAKAGSVAIKKEIDGIPVSTDSLRSLLKGKWLRSDGTYTIEIFSINADGKMDAGYFNPDPVNVGKSGWMISEGNIMLELLLKDVNYPGSKYNLFYEKENDCLVGNYFQAVQGINYDVVFSRQK